MRPTLTAIGIALLSLSALVAAQENDEPGVIRLQSQVTGDQEQPQVMYVVPWQSGEVSALPYRGLERQLDELFQPIEPGSLRRRLHSEAENRATEAP
ncbi:RNA-binding protein [Marinimicrobium alkaliphilum]|uniref:hypothetical protein n=1 Tax=Marinimicrobium alkaliphilum TaxID=2202654 RepID=UPI000DB931BE|nr:hypothetical protein [Marinimicrobium alkaliphilum]